MLYMKEIIQSVIYHRNALYNDTLEGLIVSTQLYIPSESKALAKNLGLIKGVINKVCVFRWHVRTDL